MKQFDSIPGTVHEDIDISVARITSKYIGHDVAEGVITLSHVGGWLYSIYRMLSFKLNIFRLPG